MFRFGTVPILWNNDDVPELTPGVPFERVLDEIRQAGFSGTELGSNYPRNARQLRSALGERQLVLSGTYWCPGLTDAGRADEALDQVEGLLAFLEAVGCEFLIAAEPLVPEREAAAGRVGPETPRLSDEAWKTLGAALDELGWRCKGRGIRLAFHNHAGTWVETPDELDRLLALTSPQRVGLCLDTGHCAVGGGDPADALQKHLSRLAYLHLKDVDPAVLDALRTEGFGFREALRRRLFTEIGTGSLDVGRIARILRDSGWSGWVVAEQDTTYLAPLESAAMNFRALDRLLADEPAPSVPRTPDAVKPGAPRP